MVLVFEQEWASQIKKNSASDQEQDLKNVRKGAQSV